MLAYRESVNFAKRAQSPKILSGKVLPRRGRPKGASKKAVFPCSLEFNIRLSRSGRGYIAVSSDHDFTDEENDADEEFSEAEDEY